jgi:shikimate kinase
MCSGKTRVGQALARHLSLVHVDTDRLVEEEVGPLQRFFAAQGEVAFRIRERQALANALQLPAAVISTGGGAPCDPANLSAMLSSGHVIFLDVPLEELMARITRAGGDRPLLLGLRGEELRTRVQHLLAERISAYRAAHYTVVATGAPDEVAERIAQMLVSAQSK